MHILLRVPVPMGASSRLSTSQKRARFTPSGRLSSMLHHIRAGQWHPADVYLGSDGPAVLQTHNVLTRRINPSCANVRLASPEPQRR